MKNIILKKLFVLGLLAFILASCEKEGLSQPENLISTKISKNVYTPASAGVFV